MNSVTAWLHTQIQSSTYLDLPALLALAAALGWASGIRLYAVVFATGMAGVLGWLPLPPGLQVLQHPAMLAARASSAGRSR